LFLIILTGKAFVFKKETKYNAKILIFFDKQKDYTIFAAFS